MKDKILKLRSEGKTYTQIKEVLGCSKSTISYHCGKGQKEKSAKRQVKNRSTPEARLVHKFEKFRSKIRGFKRGTKRSKTLSKDKYKDYFKKLINHPYCYLTGVKIDLSKVDTYELDHIIPFSRGGSCNVSNMGLLLKEVNRAKNNLKSEEFIELCKKVIENNGYKVIKLEGE